MARKDWNMEEGKDEYSSRAYFGDVQIHQEKGEAEWLQDWTTFILSAAM